MLELDLGAYAVWATAGKLAAMAKDRHVKRIEYFGMGQQASEETAVHPGHRTLPQHCALSRGARVEWPRQAGACRKEHEACGSYWWKTNPNWRRRCAPPCNNKACSPISRPT
jgi:hypothetical protein